MAVWMNKFQPALPW